VEVTRTPGCKRLFRVLVGPISTRQQGTIGNENLVCVAAVAHPHEAIPLQGTWYGHASDHLAMTVAVNLVD
jgi:hypothetical protein